MSLPIKILLADDHHILRTGLKLLLATQGDFQVVAEASNGQEALEKLASVPVDIILLDLSMPVMNGLECLREIKRRRIPVKILVLTMYNEQQYIKEVMTQGADGYLCKDTLDAELFRALHTVMQGKRYLSEQNTHALLDSFMSNPTETISLSAREQEVLRYLVHGYSQSSIAEELHLSIKTVSTYKSRLMQKLHCTSKSELVDYALKHHVLG